MGINGVVEIEPAKVPSLSPAGAVVVVLLLLLAAGLALRRPA